MGSTQVISRRELKTLFYVGRKLELLACYVPMQAPQPRTVSVARRSGARSDSERRAFQSGRVGHVMVDAGENVIHFSRQPLEPAGLGMSYGRYRGQI